MIVITHAAFDVNRHHSLMRLMAQLRTEAPKIPVYIQRDEKRQGSLWCFLEGMKTALEMFPFETHFTLLQDDVEICRDFGEILQATIDARPTDIVDGFVNHMAMARERVPTCWYSTPDGATGVCLTFPRKLLVEHLLWRRQHPELGDYPNDAGVNLWAVMTKRLIYKTAWSLVQHDDRLHSLDGHDAQDGHERRGLHFVDGIRSGVCADVRNFLGRTYTANEEISPGKRQGCVYVGPTYTSNVFDVVRRLDPKHWDLDAMYHAYCPVPESGAPRVTIVVPVYRESEEIMRLTRPSREAVMQDLEAHGIESVMLVPPGDSHVDRMRQRATHHALKHGATHILWWDADIECLDPTTVRKFIVSGHDIVAGACPFKDDTGRVVCNLLPSTIEAIKRGEGFSTLPGGFVEVLHAGSGFMMMSRKATLALMQAHPERAHLSRSPGDFMEPLFAIWDGEVEPNKPLMERMFLSEDWNLSRLWQELGGKVYVHAPSRFKHYGTYGFEGSFEEGFGLVR